MVDLCLLPLGRDPIGFSCAVNLGVVGLALAYELSCVFHGGGGNWSLWYVCPLVLEKTDPLLDALSVEWLDLEADVAEFDVDLGR